MLKRARAPFLAVLITGGAVTIVGGAVTPTLAADRAPRSRPPLAAATPAAAQAPAVLPTTLQALGQQMAQIHFNTARVVLRTVLGDLNPVLGGEPAAGGSVANRLITTTAATLSYSPRASLSTSTLDGAFGKHVLHRKVTERLIGKSLYVDIPSIARSDGGRPWVHSEERVAAKPPGAAEGEPLTAIIAALSPALATVPQPREHGTFADLSEDLSAAQDIHEVTSPAPLTVDGQLVAGFTATIPIASLLARDLSPKQLQRLERLLVASKPDERVATLEVFIAPSGLPVRTTIEYGARKDGVAVQEDVLALEVPLLLTPPPAGQTITEARLERLQRERAHTRKRRRFSRASHRATARA